MKAPTPLRVGFVGGLASSIPIALRIFLHWPFWILHLLAVGIAIILWRFVWKYRYGWKGKEYKVPGHD
jgi:hypothetical protein